MERLSLQHGDLPQFSWHPTSRSVRFDRLVPYLSITAVNHFEYHGELTNKLSLFKNLKDYCEAQVLNINDFIPTTFALEFESNRFHAQYIAFTTYFKAIGEMWRKGRYEELSTVLSRTLLSGENVWLLKPSNFNRGRGISVFSSIDQLKELVDAYQEIARSHLRSERFKPKSEPSKVPSLKFVIQKYIERPLLINKRKFDIRMWVLMTQDMQGYLYRQGYLRTSSEEFTLSKDRLASGYVHLTNNAVQKNGPMYGQFEDGNQLSFVYFQDYLDQNYPERGATLEFTFLPRIKDLVSKSLLAVPLTQASSKLNPHRRKVCFELFGYDFIIDEEMKVWLIEVNTNPCLELSSPLLEQLIPNMLDDMLKLTVDKVFPTEYRHELETGLIVHLDPGNNWELVLSLSSKSPSS